MKIKKCGTKIFILTLIMTLVMSSSSGLISLAENDFQILNSGFEEVTEGVLNNWTFTGEPTLMTPASEGYSPSPAGGNYIYTSAAGQWVKQTIKNIVPGDKYLVHFWVKSAGNNYITTYFSDGENNIRSIGTGADPDNKAFTTTGGVWKRVSMPCEIPEGAVQVIFNLRSNSVGTSWDDIQVERFEGLIANGDFEYEGGSWTLANGAEIVNTESYKGLRSGKTVYDATTKKRGHFQYAVSPVAKNVRYKLSLYYKGDVAAAVQVNNTPSWTAANYTLTQSDTWKKYTIYFTFNPALETDLGLTMLFRGASYGTVYFDDIKLEVDKTSVEYLSDYSIGSANSNTVEYATPIKELKTGDITVKSRFVPAEASANIVMLAGLYAQQGGVKTLVKLAPIQTGSTSDGSVINLTTQLNIESITENLIIETFIWDSITNVSPLSSKSVFQN